MLKKYPDLHTIGGKPFGLYVDRKMNQDDLAEVSKRSPHLIHLNAKAYRSREVLATEYAKSVAEGWFVAGTNYHHIIYHEFGHILGEYYKIDDVAIAKNVFGLGAKKLAKHLLKVLSRYSVYTDGEIISEMISASMKPDPADFVLNFTVECDKIIHRKRGAPT
jgi:hypothetical protein